MNSLNKKKRQNKKLENSYTIHIAWNKKACLEENIMGMAKFKKDIIMDQPSQECLGGIH